MTWQLLSIAIAVWALPAIVLAALIRWPGLDAADRRFACYVIVCWPWVILRVVVEGLLRKDARP